MLSKVKAKILAKEYINTGFNATKTIENLEPNKTKEVARNKGSRMLSSATFNKSLEEVLEEQGINDELVEIEHKKIIVQDKHLPSKNTAIDMYHKIKGNYAPEKKAILNINIQDPQAIKKRIADIEEEIKRLNQ